jgi:hypothetical protein
LLEPSSLRERKNTKEKEEEDLNTEA